LILLSGTLDTAATRQHFFLTHRLLEVGLRSSIRAHARDIVVPPLESQRMVETGLACYRAHCAQCHGAPGHAPDVGATGLMPVPASLVQTAREWPAEWLYYVTSKGVRMTGMPAWEFRLAEDSLWATVAFLKVLPSLTPVEYRERVAAVEARCAPRTDFPDVDPDELGDILVRQYGCHACHLIDGVTGPRSLTGPPLRSWAGRGYIAGTLPNTRENLVRWLRDPQAVKPGSQMPDLGIPENHAVAMAGFLFSPR
jgi:mono/diheme cytochrome c family protein